MNTATNILIAFLLNLAFSLFEFMGGALTGSVAITSDAIHDLGDALSIGLSFFLEKKSQRPPDDAYTFGYARFSVLGGAVTSLILVVSSLWILGNAVNKILHPAPLRWEGMFSFALVGVAVNLCAAFFTRHGDSPNQKAVNLHMLEDVLSWSAVLLGSVVIRTTGWMLLDPLMSIGVALFVLLHAIGNLRAICPVLLGKTPEEIPLSHLREELTHIPGVRYVHNMHIVAFGENQYWGSLHVVTDENPAEIKKSVRELFHAHYISSVTLELESSKDAPLSPSGALPRH